MDSGISIVLVIVVALIVCVLSFFAGIRYRKKISEKMIGSAEKEAKHIVDEAKKTAQASKKEIILEGKDEVYKQRREMEKELNESRKEVQRQERKIQQKEDTLDRKIDKVEKKEATLSKKITETEEKLEEIENIQQDQLKELERVSGLSIEDAKKQIIDRLSDELSHEKSVKIVEYEQKLKEESEERARKIITLAMQRCVADHVSDATISVVSLPNDDMKGRIIGREGRNIRSIETATGVDLIIDDTPEAITLSSFDPVRREIARVAIERLILDGRIHPAKIEEMVEKARKDINLKIKKEGENAVLEVGLTGVHPELIKLLGKLKFRTSYGQNVLSHSIEVAILSGAIASELGVNATLAKRAGLLHDIGKALDHEVEGSHVELGANVVKRYKENNVIVHAVQAHHGDVEANNIIAHIVQVADTLSAARPGARKENLENYIKRLQQLESLASSFDGVERCFAIQAGREIRIMVRPEVVDDDYMIPLAREISKKIESDLEYPGQIKVNIIRESRAIEYAR